MGAINDLAVKILGCSKEYLKDINAKDIFMEWDMIINKVQNNKTVIEEEFYVKLDLNKTKINLSAFPIENLESNSIEILLLIKDIKKPRKLADKIEGSYAIYTFDKAVGKDPFFIEMVEYAKKISDSDSTILITGESGIGKEIFAQSIHNYGDRKNEHFIAINCAAIPKNLIESELFGYEGGAFTGAKPGGSPGKFELADKGTIFLDEIGEMPFESQSRLLRVIEEGVIRRVGGSSEKTVDVRIIAASNRNLHEEMKEGNFRKDLYYRLNVLPLKLPVLRERPEDIQSFLIIL